MHESHDDRERPASTGLLKTHGPLIRRVIVFGIIGVLTNVIYGGLFVAGVSIAPVYRTAIAALAYASACVFQYAANALFTFRRDLWDLRQATRYAMSVALGLVLSTAFLSYAVPRLDIPDVAGVVIVALSLPLLNFIVFSRWVYRSGAIDRD